MKAIISVYDFDDYKTYVNRYFESLPHGGHGEYRRLALHLNVSTTMVSQVFKGDKHLSLELGMEICNYLAFGEKETDFFLLLINYQRAGSYRLKQRLKAQVEKLQKDARKMEYRIKKYAELTPEDKAQFYSSWVYSATRLLTDLEKFPDIATIAEHLHLPRAQVSRIMDFLLEKQLVIKKEGRLKLGPARTWLGAGDALVSRHHQNWRLRGFQQMHNNDENDLFFTVPMTMSAELAETIRRELPTFLSSITDRVGPSEAEVSRCLSLDYFAF